MKTLALYASVTSLHWSPHCKELLSTHGTHWDPSSAADEAHQPLTAAIAVHAWPSGRCVAAVRAHRAPIGGSCLSPDGTHVFTLAQAECVVKMWEVWGAREPVKKPTLLEQYVIR